LIVHHFTYKGFYDYIKIYILEDTKQINGNIGIGTITPSKALTVNGTTNAVTVDPSATPSPVINTTGSNLTISSASGSVIIRLG
jgi:hypothetical protein|tara:strand:- start:6400 stop:6651 length:252 start_codon:yes stop_codon:yes gene_type:complete